MNTSNLLNHNGTIATININNAYDKENNIITVSKSWDQLTDSDKQTIASDWIKDHIYCNVNQVMELLSQNGDHIDYDSYREIAEQKDHQYAVESDLNDKTIDELIEIIEEYDLEDDIDVDQFMVAYKAVLCKEINTRPIFMSDLLITLEELGLSGVEDNEQTKINILCGYIKIDQHLKNDDLEAIFVNLGLFTYIPFDFIEKEHKNKLSALISKHIDDDQYGQDNNLDPEYNEAYEFWGVSDHFVAMLKEKEECANDILGLSVWARYCTGQSIVLDHQIQVAAFKALSDCSFEYY